MIRRLTKSLIILLLIVGCATETSGSDPTMDYSSLQGSGMSPKEYDALVKQRQLQYAQENEDEEVIIFLLDLYL